jgi:hypothetical protein
MAPFDALRRVRPHQWILLALALGACLEIGLWVFTPMDATAAFGRPRIRTNLGEWGALYVALGAAAGAALGLPRRGGLVLLGAVAAVVHLSLLDMPQAQPDTARWFVLAQEFAASPLTTLADWPRRFLAASGVARNQLYPLVPIVYALAFRLFGESPGVADGVMTLFAVALPLTLAWAVGGAVDLPRPRARRFGLAAGWLSLGVPFLQAQSAWMLADIPLCVFVAVGWGGILRARGPGGWARAFLLCVPALLTKVAAPLFLAPALAGALIGGPRAILGAGALGYGALYAARPFRLVELDAYLGSLVGLALHLRAALGFPAVTAALLRPISSRRIGGLVLGCFLVIPALLLYTPAHHVPRYAMPLALALCVGAGASLGRRINGALLGSGLLLFAFGYRPVMVYTQAANLQLAARLAVEDGAHAIEVWTDQPGSTFTAGPITALVDFYVDVPVRYGGTLRTSERDKQAQWWDRWRVPPWHEGSPADVALLGLYGADRRRFELDHPEWSHVRTISLYQASSWLLPREVAIYRRVDDPPDSVP